MVYTSHTLTQIKQERFSQYKYEAGQSTYLHVYIHIYIYIIYHPRILSTTMMPMLHKFYIIGTHMVIACLHNLKSHFLN